MNKYQEIISSKLEDLYKRLGSMARGGATAATMFPIRLQIDLLEEILVEANKLEYTAPEEHEKMVKAFELQKAIMDIEGVKVPLQKLKDMSCDDINCELNFYNYLLSK